jgi:hypothetical protein
LTTPHILTEVSNLLGQAPDLLKREYYNAFVRATELFEEKHIPAVQILSRAGTASFGLTDLGILELARTEHRVVTADGPLANYLAGAGIDVSLYDSSRQRR